MSDEVFQILLVEDNDAETRAIVSFIPYSYS
jgi:hypothetical protein